MDHWRQTPPFGKLIVCILAVHFTYQGATKLLRSPPSSPPPAIAVVQPDAGDLDFGVDVTNLCFTAIERGTNSTALLVAWPSDDRPPLDRVGLFASLDLPGPWSHLFDIDISTCTSNALVEVMDAEVSTNSPPTAFFRLGDPAPPDADGDGLSDAEETGEIVVLGEFEWHDTSGFPTAYAPPPPSGLESYWGAYLFDSLPGHPVMQGISLSNVIAFENGFVALSAPGDFGGWIFPSATRPLCYKWGYSYSILIATYWSWGYAQYGNTNSYMRAGTLVDGTTVVEFHDMKSGLYPSDGMTCQVIIPGGTGNVVRVSYLSSDVLLDGRSASGLSIQAGVQNARRALPGGKVYSLEWNFAEWGPITPPLTVEYRLGTGTDPDSADSDNDGLNDWTELYATGTDPWNSDTDEDRLLDGDEIELGTNPHAFDTDGDNLPDVWEVTTGLDPLSAQDNDGASGDPDEDGLTNAQELQLGTAPLNPDTDYDGLDDGAEVVLGTDLFQEDTDGDGLLDGYEVDVLGSSPFLRDTDGDGLDDDEEDVLGTNPNSGDTDGDGMGDKWEHQYGFDPTVHNSQTARTDDDADADYDQDGLTNLQEQTIGTNPLLPDTDGDTISDHAEFVAGTNPCYADTDGDGLDDLQEQTLTTNPIQPDTDDDGMDDGWEHQHGFNPKMHNAQTARTDDDATADPDGDGLTNAEECKWQTNPAVADTDGDGVADGVEIAQHSDPADPSDGGQAGSRIPVSFYFGDHSESHSEKYLLTVVPVAGSGEGTQPRAFSKVNALYGECETQTNMLKRGWRYEVRLRHAGTNPTYSGTPRPDYDYTLQPITNNLPPFVQVSDPDSLFGEDDTSSTFAAKDKVATISVYKFMVEEIRFNHDMDSCFTDAVSIRRNVNEEFDTSHGEWWSGGPVLKNDPVCYAGNVRPTVKAKIRVSPHLNSARLSAQAVETSSPLKGLTESTVIFSDGMSDWTDFSTDSTIVRMVRKFDHRWEWKVSQMNGAVVSEFACATTGPHRVYTLLADPKPPWMPNGTSTKNLWTNALEFCNAFLEGKDEPLETMATITSNLFHHMGFKYDTEKGASHYWYTEGVFDFTKYMSHADNHVNCYDQAYGVATLAGLIGVNALIAELEPFGYINTTNVVGVGLCNNPCYESEEEIKYWKDVEDENGSIAAQEMSNTVLHTQVCSEDETQRSYFRAHTFVWFHDGEVFDACIGPNLGSITINDYLHSIIDVSTENERRVSRYHIGAGSQNPNPSRNYTLR